MWVSATVLRALKTSMDLVRQSGGVAYPDVPLYLSVQVEQRAEVAVAGALDFVERHRIVGGVAAGIDAQAVLQDLPNDGRAEKMARRPKAYLQFGPGGRSGAELGVEGQRAVHRGRMHAQGLRHGLHGFGGNIAVGLLDLVGDLQQDTSATAVRGGDLFDG